MLLLFGTGMVLGMGTVIYKNWDDEMKYNARQFVRNNCTRAYLWAVNCRNRYRQRNVTRKRRSIPNPDS